MKIVKNIIIFILTIILTASTVGLIMINILSSTILNKEYVLAKFDETDYYNKIYDYVEDNFEKYLYQSGFDDEVLSNLITVDQIKVDTNKIIKNIYENAQENIDTELIKNNLKSNITTYLDKNNLKAEDEDINAFINTVCNEYLSSISHYKYEQQIYNGYSKLVNLVSKAKNVCIIAIILNIILLIILNVKKLVKFITNIGISGFATGILLIFENCYIRSKIDVKNILILNDAISFMLRNIAEELLCEITRNGIMFTIIGCMLIVISSIFVVKKSKKENEK